MSDPRQAQINEQRNILDILEGDKENRENGSRENACQGLGQVTADLLQVQGSRLYNL